MANNKRKSSSEPLRPVGHQGGQNPTSTPAVSTIQTLEPWPYSMEVSDLTRENLYQAFEGLAIGRHHLNWWTTFTSHYGTEVDPIYDHWVKAKSISVDDLKSWKHGDEVSALPNHQVSGAVIVTRLMKTLRALESDAERRRLTTIRRELLILELGYLLLLYGTKRNVIDIMVPDHKVRLDYLVENLPICEPKTELVKKTAIAAGGEHAPDDDLESLVIGFQEKLDPATQPAIIGYDKVLDLLQDLIELPRRFSHLIKPGSTVGFQGILLFGPPGTGKTLMAQNLAAQQGLAFFKIPVERLISKYVGDTEKIMHALLVVAKAHAPAVLFFDEIDYLTRARSSDEAGYDRRIKSQLLDLFSHLKKDTSVLLMGATNLPWDIDPAFLSRFQQRVYFDLPSADAKVDIIVKAVEQDRHCLADSDRERLFRIFENLKCSGRDLDGALGKLRLVKLRELSRSSIFAPVEGTALWEPCLRSHPLAIERPCKEWSAQDLVTSPITFSDIEQVLSEIKLSDVEEDLTRYRAWAASHGSEMGPLW